jgi:hypothetical protein
MAMWAAGPPKAMNPSLVNSRASSHNSPPPLPPRLPVDIPKTYPRKEPKLSIVNRYLISYHDNATR